MIIEITLLSLAFAGVCFYSAFMEYVLLGLRKIKQNHKPASSSKPFVSIIIAYRNEENSIKQLIDSLGRLNYPDDRFEVILVDDGSTDNSVKIVNGNLKDNMKNISIDRSGKVYPIGKKGAIQYGIELSKGEIIFITDADCVVQSNWINSMIKHFTGDVGFIAGPIRILQGSSFFQKLFGLEQAGLIVTSAGLIGSGSPVTCNGANIAYRRDAFNYVKGFQGNDSVLSGDDDLLMQKIHNSKKYTVAFAWDDEASVATAAVSATDEFFAQRNRWASKILNYDKNILTVLAVIFIFFICFPAVLVLGLINAVYFVPLLLMILFKGLYDYRVLQSGLGLIVEKFSPVVFVTGEILHPFYIIYSVFSGQLRSVKWKGRGTKENRARAL